MRNPLQRSMRSILIALALLLAVGLRPASAAVTCNAQGSWVTSPSQPNFNVDPNTLCGFYQYSWQSFLYLVAPAPGGGGALNFETYPSVADVFGSGNTLRASANKIEGPVTLFNDKRLNKLRRFQVRGSEPLEDIAQAGSQGVLVDQNGNVTYYEQFLDPIATGFIISCDLNITACQTTQAAASLRFPAGAIELKLSWKVIPYGSPNANTYYTLENVEVCNPQVGPAQGTCSGQLQTVNLGLVGFHLVYTTANHEEMVWATFEHIDNAPNGPCATAMTPPPGFSGWAFNNVAKPGCTGVNSWTKGTLPPYPVTQAVRNYPYGSDSSSAGQNNASTIQAINTSVLGFLPAGSVWSNYFLVGAVWTDGTLPAVPPGTSGFNEKGSTFLSNGTLETFTQWPNPIAGSTSGLHINCFSCHNAETTPATGTSPATPPPFQVSHAFKNGNPNSCPYSTTLPAACTNSQTLTVQLMSAHAKKAKKK